MRAQKFIREGLEVNFEVVDHAEDIVPAVRKIAAQRAPLSNEISVTEKF